MNSRLAVVAVLLLSAVSSSAQSDEGAGIVFGTNHSFAIKAPPGWVLDNSSGKAQGLHAVFYEKDTTWAHATTVMYANSANKVPEAETVDELIAFDVAQFRKRAPTLSVTSLPNLETATGIAVVRRFEGDQYGNFEAVAYIDEKLTITMLVLSARTKDGFDKAYPSFEKLVKSYRFLTAAVEIKE